LRPSELPVVATADGSLVAVHFDVAPHGIPVEGGRVTLAISHGRVVHVDVVGCAPFAGEPVPRIGAPRARSAAIAAAKLDAQSVLEKPPALRWLRLGDTVRLAWKVTLIRQ